METTGTGNVLTGFTDSGVKKQIPVTPEGHLEVAIHAPRLPFGSIHTERLTPVFQSDAVYGILDGEETTSTVLSGVATASDSSFVCQSGTSQYSQAIIQGVKRLRYRAGQGVVGRFTALYSTPVANSYQVVGFGHAEDGVYIGYGDTNDLSNLEFGILYVNRGVREVQTLTITTASSTAENVTVTLAGFTFNIAVTNSANIQRTVWEISQGTYAGWKAYPQDDTIVFVADAAGNKTSTFSISGTTVVGSFAETKAGVSSTDLFIPQSSFNGDKLDGTGASGITIDPTKGNVFQISVQYLGYGSISFAVEGAASGNNPDFVTFHTLRLPNTLTATSFGNPSFPFSMAVYSAGSTTDLTVKCGSFAGFIEGDKMLHGKRFTYFNQLGTNVVGASNYHHLFTIQNKRYHNGRTNQVVVNLLSVTAALKHTSPCILYMVRDASLVGNPDFQDLSTTSATSWDTTATTATWSDNDQLLWTGHIGDTGQIDHHFGNGSFNAEEITLQPGERISLLAKTSTGTATFVTGSINTREDS